MDKVSQAALASVVTAVGLLVVGGLGFRYLSASLRPTSFSFPAFFGAFMTTFSGMYFWLLVVSIISVVNLILVSMLLNYYQSAAQ